MARDKGIILSEEHGLNPSIDHCRICGKEIGLVLFGKLKGDAKAPLGVCSGNLCDDCSKVIRHEGCVIIEVRDGESDNTPYRTGRLIGVNKKVKEELEIETEAVFLEHSYFDKMFGNAFKQEDNEHS